MANFALIDENNYVQMVIFVANEDVLDENGNESEEIGSAFCNSLISGNWVQTSYNHGFRKNFAGIGYSYDQVRDAFIPPKPFNSWLFDEETCRWASPVPMPEIGNYYWDEENVSWIEREDV